MYHRIASIEGVVELVSDYGNQYLSGVYSITCEATGKIYVGKSNNIGRRFSGHIFHLLSGDHSNKYLQEDFNQYGYGQFAFKILEVVDKELISAREAWWMAQFDKSDLYNILTVYDQSKTTDIKTFTDFINSKWLVPNGTGSDEARNYRIIKATDQDEIVDMAHKCKLFNLCRSKTTFLRVIKLMGDELGYEIITGRTPNSLGHLTYKLITNFDATSIIYAA